MGVLWTCANGFSLAEASWRVLGPSNAKYYLTAIRQLISNELFARSK
jgi:hypothetical protein